MTPLRIIVGLIALVFVLSYAGISGDLPECLTSANPGEAERDDPVVDVLCLKGLAAMSNGDAQKAIMAYTEAINRDPKYSYSYLGRGDAYLANGDLDRALSDYEQALRLDPQNDAAKARAESVREGRSK